MSPLTKAFVVLATILSVVMVTLTVAIVARVDDYRSNYDDLVAAKDQAIADVVRDQAKMEEKLNAQSELATQYEQEKADLAAQLRAARNDDEDAAAIVSDLQARNAQLSAASEVSAGTIEAQAARITNLSNALAEATATIGNSTGRLAATEQELISTKSTLRRTTNEYNRVVEQNVALEQQLSELQAWRDSLPDEVVETYVGVTPEVDGAVNSVDTTGDLTLVEVNVGTRDNVKDGMEFTVFRGDQYVGTIKIVRADTAASVGRLTLGEGVKAGDRVQSGR